ncbi:MAG: hypothetical protein ACLQNE_16070 [Thermoguttaceae bacterium]
MISCDTNPLTDIEAHVPARPLKPGELLANLYGRPYTPDPLDGAYGMTQAEVEKLGRGKQRNGDEPIGQGSRQPPFFF